jgi:hypothetical protein
MANHRVSWDGVTDGSIEVKTGAWLQITVSGEHAGEIGRKEALALAHAILNAPQLSPGKGPLATAAEGRPENWRTLSAEEQWDIDKRLGILDWDGRPET